MAISVNEYMNNNSLLEVYYTPFGYKLDLVDTILDNVIDRSTTPHTINIALLKNISDHLFIQEITNLDLSEEANDGSDGYDLLCQFNLLPKLLDSISDEYQRMNSILNDRLNDFYRYEYSIAKVFHDIGIEISDLIDSSVSKLDSVMESIDVKELTQNISSIANIK